MQQSKIKIAVLSISYHTGLSANMVWVQYGKFFPSFLYFLYY